MNRDVVRLQHILDAIDEILEFSEHDPHDRKTILAIERNIEIIGEACRHLSEELKAKYPKVPWTDIVGMRNVLIHEYFRIDAEIIWNLTKNKIPELRLDIEHILGKAKKMR